MNRLWILLFACCLAAEGVWAKELKDYFTDVQTWRARFTQTVVSSETDMQQQSQGSIFVRRPKQLRLEYQHPYKQLYVADGQRLWLYDEDLEQVTVKPQGESLNQTPAMILSQPEHLADSYIITIEQEEAQQKVFLLKPRSPDSGFDQIRMSFYREQLRVMEMQDSFGQRTRLQFHNVVVNQALTDELFRFTPPAGVDVIGEQ